MIVEQVTTREVNRREFFRIVLIMVLGAFLGYIGLKRFTPAFGQVATGSYTIYQSNGMIYAKNDVSITNDFEGNDAVQIISQAITAISGNGGKINLSSGSFFINNKIILPSNITLEGQGIGKTILIIKNGFLDSSILSLSNISSISIKELTIDGNKTNNVNSIRGIDCWSVNNLIISNIEIKNCQDISLSLAGVTNSIIEKNYIHDSGKLQPHGIACFNGCKYIKLVNNHIENTGTNSVSGMGIVLIESGNPTSDCIISNNTIYNCGLEGINIGQHQVRIVINNNVTSYCNDNGITVLGNDCIISNNQCSYNKNNGIYIADTNNTLITSNICKNNNQRNQGFCGIQVGTLDTTGDQHFTISSNRCYDDQTIKTQSYGCQLQTLPHNYYIITSNDFLNNVSGTLQDLTTGTPIKQVLNNLI